MRLLFILFLVVSTFIVQAQKIDTSAIKSDSVISKISTISDTNSTKKVAYHRPLKAFLFSAVLPGLGQAYNKKYWKIPIIYAGLGVASYFLYQQNKLYQGFRKAYIMKVDGDPYTDGVYVLNKTKYTSEASLQEAKNYYRRNIDLISALMAVWYGLNLVDAVVDAHLFHFDVSDNLSLEIRPDMNQFQASNKNVTTFGLKIKLNM